MLTFDNDRLLVCGGLLFYAGNNNKTGTMMAYENGEWISFQEEGILEAAGIKYYEDITGVAVDPRDAGHCFVTSRTGLYEFQDYQFVNRYTVGNSTLRSPVTSSTFERYVLTSAPAMDEQGNLFLVNDQIDTLIKVRLADGSWDGFYISEVDQAPTCDQILRDQKGRLWMTSRRTVTNHIGGLLYIDYGGTIANKNDDVYRYRNSFTNQDGTTTTLGGVYCVAEAPDGSIWVGTKNGVFQIVNPDEFATNDFRVNQPKVPRNDGTNYADYLLNGTPVTAIAIDGGNRKWLGTESSGLYLASPDGSTILAHQRDTVPGHPSPYGRTLYRYAQRPLLPPHKRHRGRSRPCRIQRTRLSQSRAPRILRHDSCGWPDGRCRREGDDCRRAGRGRRHSHWRHIRMGWPRHGWRTRSPRRVFLYGGHVHRQQGHRCQSGGDLVKKQTKPLCVQGICLTFAKNNKEKQAK